MTMKDAKIYEKKVKKLLSSMCKSGSAHSSDSDGDGTVILVDAVLQEDATPAQVQRALASIDEEFVDYNELRVAQPKEIVECIGSGFPEAHRKADMLIGSLGAIFSARGNLSLEHLAKLTKRDVRRHLLELGLSPYVSASVTLLRFAGHAIPVDQTLVECLKMEQYVHPDANLADVQGFLERIVGQKDSLAVHDALRAYVTKCFKALTRKRKAAEAAAKAAALAREKKKRQEQEAREKAARKQAAAKKKADKAADDKKKAAKAKKVKKAASVKKAKKTPKASGPRKTAKATRKTVSRSRSPKTTRRPAKSKKKK